jgi:outer membrane protein assembly factor BamB
VLWRCRTLKPVVGSPICVNGEVIFGGMDGVLRAVAADSGKPLWKVEIGGAISTSPAAADAAVVCCDEAGDVQAVSPADGKALWRAKVAGPVMASPSIGGGKVLVPVMVPTALSPIAIEYVVAFDLGTGNKVWGIRDPKNASISATTTPAISGDACYVTTTEGYLSESKLRCISVSTGLLKWQGPLGGVGDSSPALSGITVFLGCHDGTLWTWDTKTGRPSARIPIGTKVFSSPALSGGRIYIGVQGGKLICLG